MEHRWYSPKGGRVIRTSFGVTMNEKTNPILARMIFLYWGVCWLVHDYRPVFNKRLAAERKRSDNFEYYAEILEKHAGDSVEFITEGRRAFNRNALIHVLSDRVLLNDLYIEMDQRKDSCIVVRGDFTSITGCRIVSKPLDLIDYAWG